MDPKAMEPFGRALLAFFEGDPKTELKIRRDDGLETLLPMSHFFREPRELTPIEKVAIDGCVGRVLDVGAGSGLHSLVLEGRGLRVTSLDINPDAVEVMNQRNVMDVRCADIFEFRDGPYDTLLMLGHGLGMVETIEGLDQFLAHARGLVADDGQVILDSLDVRVTDRPADLAYHQTNRESGCYIGEIRMQFEFHGKSGPYCGWLQVDAETLKDHAQSCGWAYEVMHRETDGNHLARITKSGQVP